MIAVIGLTWLILGWRVAGVNQSLRKIVLGKFREALEHDDPDAEKKVRQFVGDLNIQGGMLPRLNGLIRLVPEPFVVLTAVFSGACILTYLTYYGLKDACAGLERCFLKEVVFPNCPWATLTFVLAWLICNDIWVFEGLERLVMNATGIPPEHIVHFKRRLTPTELIVFQKRFLEGLSHKETAHILGVSVSTIKTHINKINRKIRKYERDNNLRKSLLDSMLPPDVDGMLC